MKIRSWKTQIFLIFGQAIKSGDLRYRDSDPVWNYEDFGILRDMLILPLTGIDREKIDLICIIFHVNSNMKLTLNDRKLAFTKKIAPESPY